jgi:pyridoxine kinase
MSSSHPLKILSIQSHVVSGYVGNKSATFPLQLLGHQVDPLNTVQFSNHSGFPCFLGERLSEEVLDNLIKGLEENEILWDYTHILCGNFVFCAGVDDQERGGNNAMTCVIGYMGRPATLKRIIDLVKKVKSRNQDVQLFLDPVMGDNQRLYVPPEVVPLYRELCAWADFVSPNGFEAE